jgi:hypothetical protein
VSPGTPVMDSDYLTQLDADDALDRATKPGPGTSTIVEPPGAALDREDIKPLAPPTLLMRAATTAALDREDAKILRLLALGYSPQCLVVEHGIELSDIRRVCAAAGAR